MSKFSKFLQYLGNNRSIIHGARMSSPAVTDVEQTVEYDPEAAAQKAKVYAVNEGINVLGSLAGAAIDAAMAARIARAVRGVQNAEKAAGAAYDAAGIAYQNLQKGQAQLKHLEDVVKSLTIQGAPQDKIIKAQQALNAQRQAVQTLQKSMQSAQAAYNGEKLVSNMSTVSSNPSNKGFTIAKEGQTWIAPMKPSGAAGEVTNAYYNLANMDRIAGQAQSWANYGNAAMRVPVIFSTNEIPSDKFGGKLIYFNYLK